MPKQKSIRKEKKEKERKKKKGPKEPERIEIYVKEEEAHVFRSYGDDLLLLPSSSSTSTSTTSTTSIISTTTSANTVPVFATNKVSENINLGNKNSEQEQVNQSQIAQQKPTESTKKSTSGTDISKTAKS